MIVASSSASAALDRRAHRVRRRIRRRGHPRGARQRPRSCIPRTWPTSARASLAICCMSATKLHRSRRTSGAAQRTAAAVAPSRTPAFAVSPGAARRRPVWASYALRGVGTPPRMSCRLPAAGAARARRSHRSDHGRGTGSRARGRIDRLQHPRQVVSYRPGLCGRLLAACLHRRGVHGFAATRLCRLGGGRDVFFPPSGVQAQGEQAGSASGQLAFPCTPDNPSARSAATPPRKRDKRVRCPASCAGAVDVCTGCVGARARVPGPLRGPGVHVLRRPPAGARHAAPAAGVSRELLQGRLLARSERGWCASSAALCHHAAAGGPGGAPSRRRGSP